MTRRSILTSAIVASLALAVGLVAWQRTRPEPVSGAAATPVARIPANATLLETPHYHIHSTATATQTQQVAQAVESLHAAYMGLFAAHVQPTSKRMTLVLFADREEFQRNNQSRPWAEAYYLRPACYAYYGGGKENPHHWMLHETVHQLNTEVAGWRLPAWANEGVAGYLGAS